jgi:hypothetical protein
MIPERLWKRLCIDQEIENSTQFFQVFSSFLGLFDIFFELGCPAE